MAKNIVGLKDNNALSMDYVTDSQGTKLIDVIYPIGSIYMSFNSTSPADLFGGTWEQITDRFLYCADSSGTTGGSNTHQHTYGIKVGGYYKETIFAENSNTGLLDYYNEDQWNLSGYTNSDAPTSGCNKAVTTATNENINSTHYIYTAKVSATSSMPQYLTCYAWHRTA